jgi:hypothetical protein
MNLESRLSKLEQQHSPAACGYVIHKDADETNDQAIAAAGIQPSEQDLVIVLQRFATVPANKQRLVSQFVVAS